jgi:selenide,water dikinase
MPVGKLPTSAVRRILDGGKAVCAEAGIPVAGGHSIDTPEPIYGLVALGLVHPDQVKRNSGARAGDVLILGKALGIGILGAAMKKGELRGKAYAQMIESAVQLNTAGTALGAMDAVHAVTDVTGFGLLGHLLEMCRGAALDADLRWSDIPVLTAARHLAEAGYATGASSRNWDSYRDAVRLREGTPEWQRNLLTDPQTSGGLLVACAPEAVGDVMALFKREGFTRAGIIGRMAKPEGAAPRISVV